MMVMTTATMMMMMMMMVTGDRWITDEEWGGSEVPVCALQRY
jgi:hypothetical protein